MGYKDGMYDGRESQFQNGFDSGYEQGFRNGFLLGDYKARLNFSSATKNETNNEPKPSNDLILQRTTRGQCVLCTDNSLINSSIDEIVEKQSRHMEKVQNTLESRYGSLNKEKKDGV